MEAASFEIAELIDKGFAVIVAAVLLFRFERKIDNFQRSINRMNKSVLLLVLSENGTKKKAKEEAQKMLDRFFKEYDEVEGISND